ncbi:MAG: LD-carboxypeptidase [Clostridia bacterium]|nr:LD-carboxypeptidase [Clostridia bacterium]
MIRPKSLKKGDLIAIIAPSSPASQMQLEQVAMNMDKWQYKYEMLPSCTARHGHFAGTDDIRLKDLHEAFSNDAYQGIFCLKGGYGTPRLLSQIDYEMIEKHPKVFLGYSDITALHLALNQKSNLMTYHGPMASSAYEDSFTDDVLLNWIEDRKNAKIENPHGEELEVLHPGSAVGTLIGGNLSLLVSTLGSPYEIDTKGKILFIEEVHEATYRVDRMLTSLALAGKFHDCSGIILGTFSHCEPEVIPDKKADLPLKTIFNEILVPFNKPIISNLRAGHNFPHVTLPMGEKISMNTYEKCICVIKE